MFKILCCWNRYLLLFLPLNVWTKLFRFIFILFFHFVCTTLNCFLWYFSCFSLRFLICFCFTSLWLTCNFCNLLLYYSYLPVLDTPQGKTQRVSLKYTHTYIMQYSRCYMDYHFQISIYQFNYCRESNRQIVDLQTILNINTLLFLY